MVCQISAQSQEAGNGVENSFNLPPEKKSPVNIPQFNSPPVIDGKIDEPIWKESAVFKDFYQTSPGENINPSKPTISYIGYDTENLYIAFHCFDDSSKIRATVAKRDNILEDDNIRIYLDTYNDGRRAYALAFNPLGIQQDGIYTEGHGADYSVDLVMESKGVIVSDGWTVEVKIPFKSLRYSAGKNKFWGIQFVRHLVGYNNEFNRWLPDDPKIAGFVNEFGKIVGLDNIKTERTLEIIPSLTISETGNRVRTIPQSQLTPTSVDFGRFVNQPIKQDLGVNIKFNFSPNITLDTAINPDFAEIEADAPVITANQRFPIFFNEKRPFFLEGSEIFQTPLQLFYSRSVVDPDFATKLTGKVGKNTFGFLVASDKAPGNYSEEDRNDPPIRQRIDEFLDKNALIGVVRVKRDIGKENNVGFFGSIRTFPEQRNFMGGFDGRFKLNPKTTFSLQVVGTNSKNCFFNPAFEPSFEATQAQRNREICGGRTFSRYRIGNGFGYYSDLSFNERYKSFAIRAFGRSKDYRADVGFTQRTNTNTLLANYFISSISKPQAKLVSRSLFTLARINYDWQGRLQELYLSSELTFSLQRNTYLNFGGVTTFSKIYEEEFGLRRSLIRPGAFFGSPERSAHQPKILVNFNTAPNKQISFYFSNGIHWNSFDFDFGAGNRFPRVSPAALNNSAAPLDPGKGLRIDTMAGFTYKPVNPLNISLDYQKSFLRRNDTNLKAFQTNIFTLRSTYQFTRFIFARMRWDYDSLNASARGQILFGWNPNPGTAFYAGYNDNFNYNGFNPFTGQFEPRFERNSRTFFIRASYLFRKSF